MRARARRLLFPACIGLVVLSGCAGRDVTGAPGGTLTSTASPGPNEYDNPVIETDFPDPGVLLVDGTYYAYATGDPRVDSAAPVTTPFHIQLATSDDLVEWSEPQEALPELPAWSEGLVWAPEVWQIGERFVMYYTARFTDGGRQCISRAVADSPQGPFVDDSQEPMVCQLDLGGSIDPFPFEDGSGTRYLFWKNDGNCCGRATRIWAQELAADGLSVLGEPVDTGARNDAFWEQDLVEAPTIIERGGTYYMFFSANFFASPFYAVGYATSDAALGPYTDAEENPILATPEDVQTWPADRPAGPGGQAVVSDADGDLWILYHAWDTRMVGYFEGGGRRAMWLDELTFEDGRPVVIGPDDGPQAAP